MKKVLAVLLCFAYAVSLAACTNTPRFKSKSDMMEHLRGMWAVDDTLNDKTYYVFQDDKIYSFNDIQFSNNIAAYFDSFVSDGNLVALSKLDYDAVISNIGIEGFIGNPEDNTTILPSKGKVILDDGKTYEKSIIITNDGVVITEAGEDASTALTKLSNTVDFTGTHFAELFKEIKKDYAIPIYTFLKTPAEYAQMYVDELIFEEQTTETSYKLYHINGRENGVFAWDDVRFLYSTGKAASSDGNPTFQLLYTPSADKPQLIISEKLWPDFEHLLDKYAMPILSGIPGAIGTEEIMNRFEQEGKTTNGVCTYSTTNNGIQYIITIDYNKYIAALDNYVPSANPQTILIMINFCNNIKLSSIDVDVLATLSQHHSQCNQYAPDFTPEPTPEPTPKPTPAPTPSTNSSYTVTLSGSDEVFKQPSRYSAFVQTIGLSGIYTIVEEAYDDMGNLWGKLKSGIGWVLLSEATISSPRTCPQCGESEPEAIFTIDWKPGDICFGCHRYNDMGGEEGRIYCSECGADCTYRGLEEDGRCEDCHANN